MFDYIISKVISDFLIFGSLFTMYSTVYLAVQARIDDEHIYYLKFVFIVLQSGFLFNAYGFMAGIVVDDPEISMSLVPAWGFPMTLSAGFLKSVGSMPD